MPVHLSVTVSDTASSFLAEASRLVKRPRPIVASMAGAVAKQTRQHFLRLNARPNRHNWPKRQFWASEGARKTAVSEISDTGATVTIASAAIAHKLTGGVITAKRGKYLAIPLTALAYAAGSPREGAIGPGLFFIRSRQPGKGFLATEENGQLTRQYLLTPKVTQEAQPDTLPPLEELGRAAIEAGRAALIRTINRETSAV